MQMVLRLNFTCACCFSIAENCRDQTHSNCFCTYFHLASSKRPSSSSNPDDTKSKKSKIDSSPTAGSAEGKPGNVSDKVDQFTDIKSNHRSPIKKLAAASHSSIASNASEMAPSHQVALSEKCTKYKYYMTYVHRGIGSSYNQGSALTLHSKL